MTAHPIDAAPRDALRKPFAQWLAYDSTPCPRCKGPRDSHTGCDHCREQDSKRGAR